MYQQKYAPYSQMGQVNEQQQFEEEDQRLTQEVDPNYQPTQKEVKQYAIQTLGMQLPEDERFLYLAKEGLKAPIPSNWHPYQGRDGQIYYKHRITQQKTYQHPTDIQYRKKYQQQKQKMARKNLKSMAIKNNPMSLGTGNQPLGLGYQPLGQAPKLSNMSNMAPLGIGFGTSNSQVFSKQISQLDPKLQEQLQQEIQQLQAKLKKQFKNFQKEREQQSQKRLRKYKEQFQSSIKSLLQKKSNDEYYSHVKQQKQKLKVRIQEAYQDRLKDQLAELQREQENKLNQFHSIYQQDNQIKLRKHESELQERYKKQQAKMQEEQIKYRQAQRVKQKEREKVLAQIKKQLGDGNNSQIQSAVKQTYHQQLQALKQETKTKISQKQADLQAEYNQMRIILGVDPNFQLQQIASRKGKLKKITQQKIQSLKKKQYQIINSQTAAQLQKNIKQLKQKFQVKNSHELQRIKQEEAAKLIRLKQKYSKQHQQRMQKRIAQLYSDSQKSTAQYQQSMNRKLSQIRSNFIKEIQNKNNKISSQIQIKMKIKDKQKQVQNKEMLIEGIKRQLQLQNILYNQLKMQKQIAKASDIDSYLKSAMTQLGIKYKSQIFVSHQKKFNELKQKYKSDKQILASIMQNIQSNSMFPFYQKSLHAQNYSSSTTSAIIKQYNQDVRKMRKNQQTILKYQSALKRAQLNDQQALQQLNRQNAFAYQEIQIKQGLNLNQKKQKGLEQIQNIGKGTYKKAISYQTNYDGYQNVQDTLKQHSKFLVTVKNDLNRKLYKVRQNFSYRY